MRDNLINLAERVEAAQGSDPALDAEIEVAVAGFPERAYAQRNAMRPKGSAPLDRMEWLRGWGVLSFTASLDAAMTLVPEGWDWGIAYFGPRGSEAQAWPRGDSTSERKVTGSSDASIAAGLTAAALRARAAQEVHHDQ